MGQTWVHEAGPSDLGPSDLFGPGLCNTGCQSVSTQEIRSGEDAYKYLIEDTIAYVPDEWCFSTDMRI